MSSFISCPAFDNNDVPSDSARDLFDVHRARLDQSAALFAEAPPVDDVASSDDTTENHGESRSATQHASAIRESFADAHALLGQAEAVQLYALAHAYELAEALADSEVGASPEAHSFLKNRDRRFAWHLRSLMGELSFIARETDNALRNRAHDAHALVAFYPDWVEAIASGRIQVRHAREFLQAVTGLSLEQAELLATEALIYASAHSVKHTRAFMTREVAKLAAEDFEQTHARERAERNVTVKPGSYGMAHLIAYLPVEDATAIEDLLTRQARTLRAEFQALPSSGDDRTTSQIKADLFTEALLTTVPESILNSTTPGASRITATVSVTIPVLSLLEGRVDGTDPALLNGLEPMSFARARQFAANATTWQRVLTHPITGHTLSVDTYSPDRNLRRFLQVRDATCRFPGCARPAAGADVDHTKPYSEGGVTHVDNLAHLCRPHHVQKHHQGWGLRQMGGGELEFTTPLGYATRTKPAVHGPRFVPTGEQVNGPKRGRQHDCESSRSTDSGLSSCDSRTDLPPF